MKQIIYSESELEVIKQNILHDFYISNDEEIKQVCLNDIYYKYIVTSFGRVFSLNYQKYNDDLKPKIRKFGTSRGYLTIRLLSEKNDKPITCYVHRLVALHFIENPYNKAEVNHKDGNKTNNNISNLEWCTHEENVQHAEHNSLTNHHKGERCGSTKYTDNQVIQVCEMILKNRSTKEICEKTGVSRAMIKNIIHKSWRNDIVDKYDFSKYNFGKTKKEIQEHNKRIKKACKMLEKDMYTMKEISEMTGLSMSIISNIKYRVCHLDISKNYNWGSTTIPKGSTP